LALAASRSDVESVSGKQDPSSNPAGMFLIEKTFQCCCVKLLLTRVYLHNREMKDP
jgi:hypothetical protein